jgi:uncharacterized protein (TIGR03435 family)
MKFCAALFAICAIAAAQPKFESASVKRMECSTIHNSLDPATVVLRGDPLKIVLTEAFGVKAPQIVGGPSWLDDDCFEIVAKIPEGVGIAQVPAMLQTLLAERFHLAAHKEDRPRPVYALVVDKGGPKFHEATEQQNFSRVGSKQGLVFFRAGADNQGFKGALTMATVVRYLAGHLDRPVQDFTGLTGTYNIDLVWKPDPDIDRLPPSTNPSVHWPEPATAPTANLFTALRESLGLKLEARTEPVETLVIDRVDRVPIEN